MAVLVVPIFKETTTKVNNLFFVDGPEDILLAKAAFVMGIECEWIQWRQGLLLEE